MTCHSNVAINRKHAVLNQLLQWNLPSNNHSLWRHQMETFSALLALCVENPSVTSGFPTQRPVTGSFDAFFDLRLNGCISNRDAGDLRRHRAYYDVSVMYWYTYIYVCDVNIVHTNIVNRKPLQHMITSLYNFETSFFKQNFSNVLSSLPPGARSNPLQWQLWVLLQGRYLWRYFTVFRLIRWRRRNMCHWYRHKLWHG